MFAFYISIKFIILRHKIMKIAKEKNISNKFDLGPLFFVAPNPNRAIGLERHVKNYHIICSHYLDIIKYLEDDGVSVLCLNDDTIKNTGKILENKSVLDYIRSESKGSMPNIITFKPSPKIEKICEANKFNHMGNDWRLNRKFENKINFVEITRKLKIANAQSEIIELHDFGQLEKYFKAGAKCVIQLPRGFSGNSTFLLEGREDFDKLANKLKGRRIKVAKYLSGETFTINGCVGRDDVYVGKTIYQITGLTDFNGNKLGTSGNDYVYAEKLDPTARKKIFDYTKKIGRFMAEEGYKGIFGLDFIVGENGQTDLIEINPRLVGSIPVYTKLQIENGEYPFLAIHLSGFVREKSVKKPQPRQSYSDWIKEKNFSASQLILRNTIKKPFTLEKTLVSGIYKTEKGKFEFVRKSYFIGSKLSSQEILIQCASQNSLINPDMEYANIQASYGIIKQGGLSKEFSHVVRFVLDKIKLKETV